jgi:hypothetical protein
MEFSKGDEGGSAHVIKDVVSFERHLKESPSLILFPVIRARNSIYDKGLWLATGNLGKNKGK